MSFTAFHAHYLLLIFKLVINAVRPSMHHIPPLYLNYVGTIAMPYRHCNTHHNILLKYFHFLPRRLSVNHPEKQTQAHEDTKSANEKTTQRRLDVRVRCR
jgi:hypothetical protein